VSDKFRTVFTTLWSQRSYKELIALLKKEKPDIAHFHNIWYLISPSAYWACKDFGIPVVQTLHNFRVFCINGLLMRDGKVCEECIGKGPWKGMQYACYRNSKIYSAPLAITNAIHQSLKTLHNKVDCFVALTEFAKKKFIECGLPAEKISVKPNFLSNPPEANYSQNGYGIFLGRLTSEKGINILINAFNILYFHGSPNVHLKIVGEGPLKSDLEDIVYNGKFDSIEFTGRKFFDESMKLLQHARFLVLPSLCYEGFPMVIREAFACGKPVIASRLGAMAELVEDGKTGLLFETGNPEDLAQKIQWMIEHDNEAVKMGRNARKVFEDKYTAEKNFEILSEIYSKVVGNA
jgi:glycosyltransferase involved in cell wall biosynthesis